MAPLSQRTRKTSDIGIGQVHTGRPRKARRRHGSVQMHARMVDQAQFIVRQRHALLLRARRGGRHYAFAAIRCCSTAVCWPNWNGFDKTRRRLDRVQMDARVSDNVAQESPRARRGRRHLAIAAACCCSRAVSCSIRNGVQPLRPLMREIQPQSQPLCFGHVSADC